MTRPADVWVAILATSLRMGRGNTRKVAAGASRTTVLRG